MKNNINSKNDKCHNENCYNKLFEIIIIYFNKIVFQQRPYLKDLQISSEQFTQDKTILKIETTINYINYLINKLTLLINQERSIHWKKQLIFDNLLKAKNIVLKLKLLINISNNVFEDLKRHLKLLFDYLQIFSVEAFDEIIENIVNQNDIWCHHFKINQNDKKIKNVNNYIHIINLSSSSSEGGQSECLNTPETISTININSQSVRIVIAEEKDMDVDSEENIEDEQQGNNIEINDSVYNNISNNETKLINIKKDQKEKVTNDESTDTNNYFNNKIGNKFESTKFRVNLDNFHLNYDHLNYFNSNDNINAYKIEYNNNNTTNKYHFEYFDVTNHNTPTNNLSENEEEIEDLLIEPKINISLNQRAKYLLAHYKYKEISKRTFYSFSYLRSELRDFKLLYDLVYKTECLKEIKIMNLYDKNVFFVENRFKRNKISIVTENVIIKYGYKKFR